MHPLVYLMLLTGCTLAHYRGAPDTHNLLEREEPDNDTDGVEIVECPVCEDADWLSNNEVCTIERGGKTYKKCKYGTYSNQACGNRRDCYRGPMAICTEKLKDDRFDQRCARGYYCNPTTGKCQGLGYAIDSNDQWLLNPNQRYVLPDHRSSSTNLRYPIRTRRLI